ncbi:MAG: hypothetical protein U0625_03475 [Phycisphaerales bacterium]
MKIGMYVGALFAGGIAIGVGQFSANAVPGEGGAAEELIAPDVIVGAIPDVSKWGANTVSGTVIMAYSFGSTSCNIGTQQLDWYSGTNRHPVIPQNAYRVKNGRFEQIGLSYMKHGFCALQQSLCGTCQPAGGGCPSLLGIGCSDPYSASLNGSQSDLGPRYEVNASTGAFPATGSTTWPAIPSGQSTIGRRVQIKQADLDPAQNTGAVYFAECQYVHPQDAVANNDNNNASYRTFTVGALSGGAYTLTLTGGTNQQKPAIYGWKDVVPAVLITAVDAADGRFMAGYNVTNNGNGTWHYEYAIHNLNSDSSGKSFSIPVPAGVTITNAGFRDVQYQPGEPYDGTDWTITVANGAITWACTQTFAQNPNANALRWATCYNFWFDASTAPTPGTATIGYFKTAGSVNFTGNVPSAAPIVGDLNGDGHVDGADLGVLLAGWGNPGASDLNGDGTTDGADLGVLLANWG